MTLTIRAAGEPELPAFFAYLDDHLSDNGRGGTALFMPMPRAASRFGAERQDAFRRAVAIAPGQPGWRKLWLAFTGDGRIAGHIDLRARPEPAAAHRALLGMGVDRDHRREGLGQRLIATACLWAVNHTTLDWIDLEVLSTNAPARKLYAAAGFTQAGEIADLFRIDGESLGYTFMQRRLR
jgi:RimJ/RimL family protein N-acetyltransferase